MRLSTIIALAGASLGSAASAQVFEYAFTLDGSQEVPPVMTRGTGKAFVSLDTSAATIKWEITFQDLSGPAVGAHFHGPAGPGATAGIRLNIGSVSGLTSPMVGSAMIDDMMAQEIIDGLWYVNIHTGMHPPGEIRGQVVDAAGCYADCDGSGGLDFFDFLCFQNAFALGEPYADCDASGALDFFDFLCYQNEFGAGCP
ncbi:MAG: CHRD domain-containing protein [Phycisphaerales bacterium JB039]